MTKTIAEYINDYNLPDKEAEILTIMAEEYNITSVDLRQITTNSYGASYQGVKNNTIMINLPPAGQNGA